jgi:hypothetical protein
MGGARSTQAKVEWRDGELTKRFERRRGIAAMEPAGTDISASWLGTLACVRVSSRRRAAVCLLKNADGGVLRREDHTRPAGP